MAQPTMGKPISLKLSIEGALGLLAGIVVAVAELNWWVRGILVAVAIGILLHLVWRIPLDAHIRFLTGIAGTALLLAVTWHPIWEDFHKAREVTSSYVGILKRLSNKELRDRTIALAEQMRTFDIRRTQISSTEAFQDMERARQMPATTEEERHRRFIERVQKDMKGSNDEEIEFSNRYRPDALALRNELVFRIRNIQGMVTPEPRDTGAVKRVLEFGSLAGPHPIVEVADYLDSLARLLEDDKPALPAR
jgi:hypothetical protein